MRTAGSALHVAVAAVFFSALLGGLFLGAACASRHPSLDGGDDKVVVVAGEEKVRLGSSPPSCYRKGYGCSPCVAVQVPSLSAPSVPATAAKPVWGALWSRPAVADARLDDAPLVTTFTNYKPLGWNCGSASAATASSTPLQPRARAWPPPPLVV
ncbi:hypothetical protein GUJ93_ZPchr0010g8368 [Zizania palustris]|uniref:Epidermal patterning factor-like protein n=1 Tax=Zizania palustris TaxID=103762 RepID=A0A8J5WAZ7_ZIZPA|nr:hypothetical protein GUJ93_ZPchr0010g8368 [Zizania palustris]